jgi:hypothetical protein
VLGPSSTATKANELVIASPHVAAKSIEIVP